MIMNTKHATCNLKNETKGLFFTFLLWKVIKNYDYDNTEWYLKYLEVPCMMQLHCVTYLKFLWLNIIVVFAAKTIKILMARFLNSNVSFLYGRTVQSPGLCLTFTLFPIVLF